MKFPKPKSKAAKLILAPFMMIVGFLGFAVAQAAENKISRLEGAKRRK
jgi:uncharacterized membrane protein